MIPYSRPKLSDLYSLSQSKLLVTLHFTAADTLVYGPYMAVPSPPPPATSAVYWLKMEICFLS